VEALREARPDVEIHHTPPDARLSALQEVAGAVTLRRPGGGLQQWSIFQSLAPALGVPTNYDAERRIRREVKARAPEVAKRLEWDTEGGAVGIYAGTEEDIRAVAEIINELIGAASK
jgi:predicted molibdopterin-dependent oxidoreductase YjgC